MKSRLNALLVCAAMLAGFGLATPAFADPVTIVGPVTKIEMAKDGKSAEATLKDNKGGALVVISISDDLTLDKFKDKRIQVGDEIRTRFEKGDKNVSKSFKKTAGC
ncbi:MAG TPA: hypothetical protein VKP68_16295 [Ramlibacter sp.]|nr:hypothetical protein [Ramlibacter sp.]